MIKLTLALLLVALHPLAAQEGLSPSDREALLERLEKIREQADSKVDAVSIATPNHWHALAAIWAMKAGKDVYAEKPASYNIAEGLKMVEVARDSKRMLQIGSQHRSNLAECARRPQRHHHWAQARC